MKHVLLSFLLISTLALAKSGQIDASADTIPVAYDAADAGSTAVTCNHSRQMLIQNETAERLAWGIGTPTTAPSQDEGFAVAATTVARDGFNVSNNDVIYIRSDSGAPLVAGVVSVECW